MAVKKSLTNWSELLLMHQIAFWVSEIARVSYFNVNLSSLYNLSFAILTCVGFCVANFPETSRSFNRIEIWKLLSLFDGLVNGQFVCLFLFYMYLIFRVQESGVHESVIQCNGLERASNLSYMDMLYTGSFEACFLYVGQMSKDEAEALRAPVKMCFELLFLSLFQFVCQTALAQTVDVCVCVCWCG